MKLTKIIFSLCTFFLINAVVLFGQIEKIRFDRISIQQGLSQSSVNVVLQDKKGFIWIGTQDGLNIFDGYKNEVYYSDPADTNSIPNNYINSLFEDSKGYIWIGTNYGLCRYDPTYHQYQRYFKKNGLPDNAVREVVEDNSGKIWVGTVMGGISSFDEKSNTFIPINQLPEGDVTSLFIDDTNLMWIGTNAGTFYKYNIESQKLVERNIGERLRVNTIWDIQQQKDNSILLATDNGLFNVIGDKINENSINNTLPSTIIRSVFIAKNGELWIGTNEGLVQANGSQLFTYQYDSNNPNSITHNQVQTIYLDRGGIMWIGTNNGLNKFDTQKVMFSNYREIKDNENTLSGQNVWSIYETKDKKLWVGTRKALNIYSHDRKQVRHYNNISNSTFYHNNKSVMSIYEDKKGRVYVGVTDGLYFVERDLNGLPTNFIKLKDNTGLVENMVYKITEDSNENLWVGTKNGLEIFSENRMESSFFTNQMTTYGLPHKTIREIKISKNGVIWIGSEGGLSQVLYHDKDSLALKNYKNEMANSNSLSNNMVISILEGDEQQLWLGTYGGGLNLFDIEYNKFSSITERNGIANNVVYGVLSDKNKNLWMSTNKGITFYNPTSKEINNYIENDGLQSNEFNIGASFQSNSGELFFGGINGFNAFMPENIQINPNPPQIVFTDIKFSNKKAKIENVLKKQIQEAKRLDLSYRFNDLSIEFAALHFSFPEKNQYAYKMVGYDDDWIYSGTQRFANYTNLDAGDYTFIVKGSNSDGVWSEEVATLAISITPPFWETWWFRISFAGLVVGLIILIYKIRVKQIEDQKEALEITVSERTAVVMSQKEELEKQKTLIEEEKEKSEKLLLNILPRETVDELKHRGKASARNYKQATVMFTDFKGFTQISEKYRPQQVVEKLDSYFVEYDEIIARHDMEKIKTIGDAYMAAGGVPIRNKSNPIDVVLAGLEIQNYMNKLRKNPNLTEEVWRVRIGIHTGELIAGVIGIKRFAYDIWGDTVNVANRMEMTCEPDKVNISGETYKHIKGFFDCTNRGKVAAKNKGDIDMYFVDRIKPELSVNEEGIVPNEMFWEYVNLSLYSSINYSKAEKFIIKLLEDGLSPDLHYHNIDHMKDVCKAVTKIGKAEGIKGEELFLLKTAALYHDAGFVHQYKENEPLGAKLARETLPKYGFSVDQVSLVESLILSTRVPQAPKTHLEEIICDADLDYLGRDDFHPIADGLKKEFMAYGIVSGDRSWDELQVKFLSSHSFHTASSIKTRRAVKIEHLEFIKRRLEANEYTS